MTGSERETAGAGDGNRESLPSADDKGAYAGKNDTEISPDEVLKLCRA